jgi:glutathione S-transferase
MKLLYAGASPFVSKAAMAAQHAGILVEHQAVDSTNEDPVLLEANPLGKIPALVLDDGAVLYDSRVITRYFDRQSGGKLLPLGDPLLAERYEAHCDGIAECAVAGQYERRFRPDEKVHQPWIDRQWAKVERGLDNMPGPLPEIGSKLGLAGIALGAMLGYLDLRYTDSWRGGRDSLVTWFDEFRSQHNDLAKLLPQA